MCIIVVQNFNKCLIVGFFVSLLILKARNLSYWEVSIL